MKFVTTPMGPLVYVSLGLEAAPENHVTQLPNSCMACGPVTRPRPYYPILRYKVHDPNRFSQLIKQFF
jgi:hypothetical protein